MDAAKTVTRSEVLAGEFNLSRLERVIYGPGKIAALKDEMERRSLHRAVVVTTDVVAKLPILQKVTEPLGTRCAGVFTGVVQHVPRGTVNELGKELERLNADCAVSLGGGSFGTIGLASFGEEKAAPLAVSAPVVPSTVY